MNSGRLLIDYFSDVLCVWAWVGQVRLDEAQAQFGAQLQVEHRFVSVYGDVWSRIRATENGSDGSPETYARKIQAVAARFAHVRLHPEVFLGVVPKSSNVAHLVLSGARIAVAQAQVEDPLGERLSRAVRALRQAFFEQGRDVGRLEVGLQVLGETGFPLRPVEIALSDGSAMALLSQDFKQAENQRVTGSPTWVLDGGRQKLFGNVGYRVIEANLRELLSRESARGASWC